MMRYRTVAAALLFIPFIPLTAAADAIDGHWCLAAKRLEIAGVTIVTPDGNRITGNYGRHEFSYVVPACEAGAGTAVDMDLLGEDDMRLWPAGRAPDPAAAGAQMWKRCAAPTS